MVVADADGKERRVGCRFVIDASGYGRVLPRQLGLDEPSTLAHRRSVFTHVTGDRRPEGDGEGSTWIVTLGGSKISTSTESASFVLCGSA